MKLPVRAQDDPEIQVYGFGVMRLSQAKAKVKSYAVDIDKYAREENWPGVANLAYSNGVLEALIKAIRLYHEGT